MDGKIHLLVGPLITHDTDGLDRKEDGECLAYLVVQTSLTDLGDIYFVRLLEYPDLLACDWPKNTNGESGSREGVALNKVGGNVEKATERTDLV